MNESFLLFLKQLKQLNLPKGEYAIWGSGPLGIRNIRDTHDLDVIVNEELFNKYKNVDGWTFVSLEKGGDFVEMLENNGIEFYKEWGPGDWDTHKIINEAEVIGGMPFVGLETVKKWKQISGREKDLKDIQLIEEYLQKSEKQK